MNKLELALLCELQDDVLSIIQNLNNGEVTILVSNGEIARKYDADSALRDLLDLEEALVLAKHQLNRQRESANVPNESDYDPTEDQERAGERRMHGRGLD